jgi:hypothetical protein
MNTSRPEVHVCVATGQNLPNLIPALQCGARKVVILETSAMKASAANLQTALQARGIEVLRRPFDDATPTRIMESAQAQALILGETPLVFNATGGHKLITLAMERELRELAGDNLHLLYCETRHGRLDWLHPRAQTQPMQDVLSIEDTLLAQGFRITGRGERDTYAMLAHDARATLTRSLGDKADKLARFFGTLNKLADRALNEPDGPLQLQQALDFAPGGLSEQVLRQAQENGLLHWDGDTDLVFQDGPSAQYFRGGWLEEYVALKLRGIRPRDYSINLKVQSVGEKNENEFDALVVHRNRLLLIECKTSRFGRDAAKDASYIYKLAQLSRRVGGIMASSLLISARPLGEEALARARDSNVDILAAQDIKNFVGYVNQWMDADR